MCVYVLQCPTLFLRLKVCGLSRRRKKKKKKKRNDILLQFSFAFDHVTSLELSLLRIVHLLPFMKQKGEKDVRWGGGGSLIYASELAHWWVWPSDTDIRTDEVREQFLSSPQHIFAASLRGCKHVTGDEWGKQEGLLKSILDWVEDRSSQEIRRRPIRTRTEKRRNLLLL